MIDIHSHILPGIDDGSKDINVTLNMIKNAARNGTKKIVATPHYYKGNFETKYNEVKDMIANVKKITNDHGIEIYHGQEVFLNSAIIEDFNKGYIGTINDSKYMLIEFSMKEFERDTMDLLYELQLKGIKPIIAHPERYRPFIKSPEKINDFIKEGYLFQLNSGSISGLFGKDVKKTAEILLENKVYSFLGSDAHGEGRRNTSLKESEDIIKSIDKGAIDTFNKNGIDILSNNEIIFEKKLIKNKRTIFSFFKK